MWQIVGYLESETFLQKNFWTKTKKLIRVLLVNKIYRPEYPKETIFQNFHIQVLELGFQFQKPIWKILIAFLILHIMLVKIYRYLIEYWKKIFKKNRWGTQAACCMFLNLYKFWIILLHAILSFTAVNFTETSLQSEILFVLWFVKSTLKILHTSIK